MGRSRAVSHSANDDPSRAKRKKIAPNLGSIETASTVYQELNDGEVALYHCNYCNKNISGVIRIKCAVCHNFDLCIECFSVGAEVTPHKSNHPYRVIDNLSFPLICLDWNADEEILLLEGIEMYGFGNWIEVADHVGTKSKSQCLDHYYAIYMNSPCFPLPDMSHVMGKSRAELCLMAKEHDMIKKESSVLGVLTPKDELPSARIKNEAQRREDSTHQSSSIMDEGLSSGNAFSGTIKRASNMAQIHDDSKVEDRSIGEKKPRVLGEEGPSMSELSGYNFKRQEFEVEYDNNAEQLLADMEFKDGETDAEYELKLHVLRIYSKRLDERKRRKDFILERNLLYTDQFEKTLSPEENEIYQRYKVFMRFHSKEEHEQLIRSVIEEHRIIKRIVDLQEARAAGCQTAVEANRYIEQKRNKEAEESAQRIKENMHTGPSKTLPRPNHLKGEVDGSLHRGTREPTGFHPDGKDFSSTIVKQVISSSLDDWDITGFPGSDLLSESEKRLCVELRILPSHYLNMLETMSAEIMKGTVTEKSGAHSLFKVEQSKVDKVYDMLMKKGIAQTQ